MKDYFSSNKELREDIQKTKNESKKLEVVKSYLEESRKSYDKIKSFYDELLEKAQRRQKVR